MTNSTPHTIYLQDGTLCNLNKRITRQAVPLMEFLNAIPDPRNTRGRRHSVGLILCLVFTALLRGSKDITDAHLYAVMNQKFLRQYFALRHGIPDPTTISRLLQVLDPDELVNAGLNFFTTLNIPLGEILSFDGKTIKAVSSEEVIRHMLSFFSHGTHLVLGQVGVCGKENEIPAAQRILARTATETAPICSLTGRLLLGDALHTQKATAKAILRAGADYLFAVKGNQKQLFRTIQAELAVAPDQVTDSFAYETTDRKRSVTTTVTALSATADQELLASLIGSDHWDEVQTMGILRRTGIRTSKDGKVTVVDETIGFISSRTLTAEQVARILREHWCIENNLHWVKDVVFGEDKHTLRKGNAPQVMSFLRSMCISICNLLKLRSISTTIHNLEKSPALHQRFLKMAAVV